MLFILFNSPVGGVEYTEGEFGYTAGRDVGVKGGCLLCAYTRTGSGQSLATLMGNFSTKRYLLHFADDTNAVNIHLK